MKRSHLALILPFALFSFPALAEQTLIKPQTQGEVTFVSSGVGPARSVPQGRRMLISRYRR